MAGILCEFYFTYLTNRMLPEIGWNVLCYKFKIYNGNKKDIISDTECVLKLYKYFQHLKYFEYPSLRIYTNCSVSRGSID